MFDSMTREEGRRKRGRGKREEGRGKREEGRGKREEGRGSRAFDAVRSRSPGGVSRSWAVERQERERATL
jgi:hypothetical protein